MRLTDIKGPKLPAGLAFEPDVTLYGAVARTLAGNDDGPITDFFLANFADQPQPTMMIPVAPGCTRGLILIFTVTGPKGEGAKGLRATRRRSDGHLVAFAKPVRKVSGRFRTALSTKVSSDASRSDLAHSRAAAAVGATSFAAIQEIIMQVKYYTISPGCTDGDGNKLFLTTGPLGSVMVDKQSTAHPDSQLWALIPPSKPYGLLIVSKSLSTGSTMMAIDAPNPNATVRLVSSQTLVHGAWNVVDSGAIQLHANPSMNLNVDGSQAFGSTSKVLAWTWGGGSPNEVWTFTPEGQVTSLIAAVAQA